MKLINLKDFQCYCLENNLPFVSFKGSNNVIQSFITNKKSIIRFNSFHEIKNKNGFVFTPFNAEKDIPNLLFQPIKTYIGEKFNFDESEFQLSTNNPNRGKEKFLKSTDKREFSKNVKKILSNIASGSIQKLVLSKIKTINNFNILLLPKLFLELLNQHTKAFIYFIYVPNELTWMGASPELFLKNVNYNFQTVAMAGTSTLHKQVNKVLWTQKELLEQKFVTDFIVEVLQSGDVKNIKKQKRETIRMGDVYHLQTKINFNPNKYIIIPDLIKDLHPTPAVCGIPQRRCNNMIKQLESHNREYYSGLIGKWSTVSNMELFVNLRCLQFSQNKIILYAGCGITNNSIPVNEWEETCNKTKLLERIILKIKLFEV